MSRYILNILDKNVSEETIKNLFENELGINVDVEKIIEENHIPHRHRRRNGFQFDDTEI